MYLNVHTPPIITDPGWQIMPLHDVNVEVLCAISATAINRLSFLSDTINSKGTLDKFLHNFFENLSYEDRNYGSFQKDGATAHTA